MKKEYAIALIALLGLGLFFFTRPASEPNKDEITEAVQEEEAQLPVETNTESMPTPKMVIDKTKTYTATFKTSQGDIVIALNAKETPITVNNFVTLAKKGFYDKTVFHRVIDGFMIQGGDPKGTGAGGPGYRFDDEPFTGDYKRGVIAMANAGPNTNGSQFFIMHADYDLPKNYVIFGKVTKGIETVDKIATTKVQQSTSGEMSDPVEKIVIKTIKIPPDSQ